MNIDEIYGFIECFCGEKFQVLKEYSYTDELGRIITYIDVDNDELSRMYEEHLKQHSDI